MSTENRTVKASARSLQRIAQFPPLLIATVGLVAATILLGVATKAAGAGLACDANWPLCDGGILNLFPATFPSFFEWIHRVVAMIAGFAILGTAVLAWRSPSVDRRVTGLVIVGAILLPIQVVLGRETVLQYEMAILSAHFWMAIAIYALFVLATAWTWLDRLRDVHAAVAFGSIVATIPLHVAVSPLFVSTYTPTIQTLQYAFTLAIVGAAVLASVLAWNRWDGAAGRPFAAVSLGLAFLVVLFARQTIMMAFSGTMDLLYAISATALLAAAIVGVVLGRRGTKSV